jgi:hypothetical protein
MKIRYQNTLEDIIAFNCYHHTRSPAKRRSFRRLNGVLFFVSFLLLALATLGLLLIATTSFDEKLPFAGAFGVAILGLLVAWQSPRIRRALISFEACRVYREGKNKNVLCVHELELTADRLIERTPVSESSNALESLERVVCTDRYAFIYQSALNAKVIPRYSVSEGDFEAFVEAVRERLPSRAP